jgi:hypothetical protein
MGSSELVLAALKFNERINKQDLEGLAELMTNDHTFIDNFGEVTRGKEVMKEAWKDFFRKYPDYRNMFTCVTIQNNVVVMLAIPHAHTNHLMVQAFGLLRCVVNLFLNGECIGLVKGENENRQQVWLS